MTPAFPVIAYAAPPLWFILLVLACYGFLFVFLGLATLTVFAWFEGGLARRTMLWVCGISALILLVFHGILGTASPFHSFSSRDLHDPATWIFLLTPPLIVCFFKCCVK